MKRYLRMTVAYIDLNNFINKVFSQPHQLFRRAFGIILKTLKSKNVAALADQAVVSGTNFLIGVLLARTLPKEDFGLYMLGFGIVMLISNIQTSLISTPYAVFSPKYHGREKTRYTGSTLIHQFAFSVVGIFSLVFSTFVLSFEIGPQGLSAVIRTIYLVVSFLLLKEYARRVYFAWLKLGAAFVFDLCISVCLLGGLYFLATKGKLSVFSAYWMVGGVCGVASVVWLLKNWQSFYFSPHRIFSHFRKNWALAKWQTSTTILVTLRIELYPWFLTGFYGLAVAGELSACRWIIFLANPFLLGMSNLLVPKTAHAFAKGGWSKLMRIVNSFSLTILFSMGIFCISIFLTGGWILESVYGAKYASYGSIVSLLALGQLIYAINIPVTCGLVAIGRTDIPFKSSLISMGITLLSGFPLIWLFGLKGAAVSMILTSIGETIFKFLNFMFLLQSLKSCR